MLNDIDSVFTPAFYLNLRKGQNQAAEERFLTWKKSWEASLGEVGWLRLDQLPRKFVRKLLPKRLEVRPEQVSMYNPRTRGFLTFFPAAFCLCCASALSKLQTVNYPKSIALIHADPESNLSFADTDGSIIKILEIDEHLGCFEMNGIVDYKARPYQIRKDANLMERRLWPSTDERVLAMFEAHST